MDLKEFIKQSLAEDCGAGDFTTLGCVASNKKGKAQLLVKENGVIAGIELAEIIFRQLEEWITFEKKLNDGDKVKKGDVAFIVNGHAQTLLTAERLVLNCMQRMSGIATETSKFVEAVKGTGAKILDTRKTTPLNRLIEKWAVRIGGGYNHRFGLFDMIMIKDNHVDYAGGIKPAIHAASLYLRQNNLFLDIEIETRNIEEVKQVLATGQVKRIMLDNFSPSLLKEAIALINKKYETEASGGITLQNIMQYAETGVDFISTGTITHSVKSIDLSLKAI